MARISVEDLDKVTESVGDNKPFKFFKLKDDGDSALVRIMAETKADIDANYIHEIEVEGRTTKVSCLRGISDPVANCPLCEAGFKPLAKVFFHFIEYSQNEKGETVGTPSIFERNRSFIEKLSTLIEEYEPLHANVFKVVRNGKAGDMKTTYEFLLQPSTKYNNETHPYYEDDLNYVPALGTLIKEKTADELKHYLSTGKFPSVEGDKSAVQPRPAVAQPTVQPRPAASQPTGFVGPRTRI